MKLEPIDTSTTAGKARDPEPNWCRTCDRFWKDPLAQLFCRDKIHLPDVVVRYRRVEE